MSEKALVYFKDQLAGYIEETEDGDFVFQYAKNYLKNSIAQPLSFSLPLQEKSFSSQYIKGFFDGLLPEGWILKLASDIWKFHPIRDRYELLIKTCFDPVGAVSILSEEQKNIDSHVEEKTLPEREQTSPGKCLLCYEELASGEYHEKCCLEFFGMSTAPQIDLGEEVLKELVQLNIKNGISVQGVQKKLSLDFSYSGKEGRLCLTRYAGKYILKPKGIIPHIPENEDLVMKMAKSYGIPVAQNCLIYLNSGELATLSKRLDRGEQKQKYHMEDFCQILDQVTAKKYVSSYQRVGKTLIEYCKTNAPKEQVLTFFELVLFSYVVGNSDLHLKNISVIHDPKPRLSPAYDLLSFEIFQEDFKERDLEIMALAINGKKNKLKKEDFDILAFELGIKEKVRDYVYKKIREILPDWTKLIKKSFLAQRKQNLLIELVGERSALFVESKKA